MKVTLDGTPLLGSRTGIGQYTSHLLAQLAQDRSLALTAVPFSLRRAGRPVDLPEEVSWKHRPIPARLLQKTWRRWAFPPAEALAGSSEIFHATNFVLPPLRHAAGVMTVHDLSFVHFPELVNAASLSYQALVPEGLARARAVLTPTAAVAQELIETYRLAPELVTVTPLGVDPQWATSLPFEPSELAARGLPTTYVLAVGTIEPRKGLDVLVQAYRRILDSGHDVPPLVLVGPKGWGEALTAAELPPGRLYLPGYLGFADLQRVVSGASVFVFPSRYEGFGLPPLEALAAGVPVIGSDIATSVEVLGPHAKLPPVGDVEALACALIEQLEAAPDPVARALGRSHALSWTWENCAERTKAAYSAALDG